MDRLAHGFFYSLHHFEVVTFLVCCETSHIVGGRRREGKGGGGGGCQHIAKHLNDFLRKADDRRYSNETQKCTFDPIKPRSLGAKGGEKKKEEKKGKKAKEKTN